MYQIEKNIPISKIKHTKRRKYPFDEMEIGDSFIIKNYRKTKLGYAANYVSNLNKRTNKRFIQRLDSLGLRIWRVK